MTSDYTLTIGEVAERLNKSTRTIHRYKDSGRLSYVVGTSHGNPLYFSRSEVEALARELGPRLPMAGPWSDPAFLRRLERLDQVLDTIEQNPLLARISRLADRAGAAADDDKLAGALRELAELEAGGKADRRALGTVLVRLGRALLAGEPAQGSTWRSEPSPSAK